MSDAACPCGSPRSYADCCAPIHANRAAADTAEALMRARYSAFVLGLDGFIDDSWDPATRPAASSRTADARRWLGMKIRATEAGGADDDAGVVEFIARYKIDGRGYRIHQISRFRRSQRGWQYVDSDVGAKDSSQRKVTAD